MATLTLLRNIPDILNQILKCSDCLFPPLVWRVIVETRRAPQILARR